MPTTPAPSRRLTALGLLLTAVAVLLGYALKAQCLEDYDADRDRLLCSNDIQVLYSTRGLGEERFPYVSGGLTEDGALTGGVIEYPVLTGLFAWVAALPVDSPQGYLRSNALLLAPFAFLTTVLLLRMARWRALLWAAGPPLVLYSFHNWDLLVVAATVAALWSWWRGRPLQAAALLGVGAALKVWPGFFVLPLALERLKAGDRRGAGLVAAVGAGTFALVNAPFLLANPAGWWAPYAFQERRGADITSNSIWFWAGEPLTTEQLNGLIPVLLLVVFTAVCGYGWTRPGAYPFLQVSAALLCAFLLLNKAHSPQFALWLLPFFVLVRLRWGWVAAYLSFDLLLYVGLFRWYHDLAMGRDFGIWKQMLVIGVWGRAAVLVLLLGVLLHARTVLDDEPAAERPREPVAA